MDWFDKLMVIFLIVCGCSFTYQLAVMKRDEYNCSTKELHEVIEKVEECTKENVICSTKMKDKILKEICQ